jgi:hypothetical protein
LNFTRKTDIGFTREIQRGIPSSTNEFTYSSQSIDADKYTSTGLTNHTAYDKC